MRQLTKTAVSIAAAQVVVWWSSIALAQTAPAPEAPASAAADGKAPAAPEAAASGAADGKAPPAPAAAASAPAEGKPPAKSKPDPVALQAVVITGQRAALISAQKLKQEADEVVDSIVAEDIGKLPDRSVTEVLQRIVGVTMDRTMSRGDPGHYSVEGSGVNIRGLSYVSSQLNGRESFSANGGRMLSFEDVPPELMAGVDVYKNPSAEQIEGAIGGLVNLRTAMPFDFKGFKGSVGLESTTSKLRGNSKPSVSALLSNRWDTEFGQFGALVDLAHSKSSTRTDTIEVDPYYIKTPTDTQWVPKSMGWRTLSYDRQREGAYGALQWKKDDLQSSLTYFRSNYKFDWSENALFSQTDPYRNTVDPGAIYGANGALLRGTIRNDADGGISFDSDTRFAKRESLTQEATWNLIWNPDNRWRLSSDVQLVRAKTAGFDSTVATGVQLPKENLDLTGKFPTIAFDASDVAYLSNPANYYWAFTMDHADRGTADQKVWKGDARFTFDDPVLKDVRFGLRLTNRNALTQNSNPSYNWATITHPWQLTWDVNRLAYLSRFGANMATVQPFSNFMGGAASVPNIIAPTTATAGGYPDSYATLHGFYETLCAEAVAAQGYGCFNHYKPSTFGTDPSGTNEQNERSQTAYTQLRFAVDDWKHPVDGNVGLRVVQTQATASGYTVLTSTTPTIPAGGTLVGTLPTFNNLAEAQSFKKNYTSVLPSLNLRTAASDKLQFRMAWAQAISRPDFSQLQAYTTMTSGAKTHTVTNPDGSESVVVDQVNLTGNASGNPELKPVRSNQLDLTAEWYLDHTSSLTFAVFDKRLKDIIVNQTLTKQVADVDGNVHDFTVTGPVNGAKGKVQGLEVAYQTYFDKLPGWMSGLGMQANFTLVNSKQTRYNAVYSPYCTSGNGADNLNLFINGCDTDGRSFSDLPMPNLSRHTINLALLYDKDAISARLAYSWRSRYLYGVAMPDNTGTSVTNGLDTNPASATYGQHVLPLGLPVWAADYGQLDGGFFYKVDDQLTLGLEGQNLTNSMYKQEMQQHIGMMGRTWFTSGPRYTLTARYSF